MAAPSGVTVPAALGGERVDRAVALLTGLARSEVAAQMAAGGVRLNGRTVTTRSHRVAAGDQLEVPMAAPPAPALEPDPSVAVAVVHADHHLVVVDKSAGVVVHPGPGHRDGTLVQGLLARFPDLARIGVGDAERPGIVHRLDRGTSGLLTVARSADAYYSLVDQLRRRAVERRYLALAWGRVAAAAGVVDAPVGRASSDPTRMAVSAGGRPARTRFRVIETLGDREVTLLECGLETGRTHQIRVHLASIGHPLVGDDRYRGHRPSVPLARPFLHAHHLSFRHPGSGERVAYSSQLPADLQAVLSDLR